MKYTKINFHKDLLFFLFYLGFLIKILRIIKWNILKIKNNINNHEVESKTMLNENNEIEFPEPNTYLHDNVD